MFGKKIEWNENPNLKKVGDLSFTTFDTTFSGGFGDEGSMEDRLKYRVVVDVYMSRKLLGMKLSIAKFIDVDNK